MAAQIRVKSQHSHNLQHMGATLTLRMAKTTTATHWYYLTQYRNTHNRLHLLVTSQPYNFLFDKSQVNYLIVAINLSNNQLMLGSRCARTVCKDRT